MHPNDNTVKRLYVLDFGLFRVTGAGEIRTIGIPGYLIVTHDDKHILVDTGFHPSYAEDVVAASERDLLGSFGEVVRLTEANLPAGQLTLLNLTPADIDILVMTHTHIDHVGGIGDFPNAPIVIDAADRAYPQPQYWAGRSEIEWPLDRTYQLIEEDTQLCPGVDLLVTRGHAPGHLSLMVHLPNSGPILLTGDAISRPSEVVEGYAGSFDPVAGQANADRLMALAKQKDAFVIYGHDPEQWPTLKKAPDYFD